MTDAPYQVMPPLSADEREALKADIAERGVMVPVEYDEEGNILDGHHRVEICAELKITHWPRLIRHGLSEAEKRRHARRLNLDRRHLDAATRRKLIADDLREAPEASDRKIAAGLGVSHTTVGAVRDRLESTGQIGQLDKREGRDKKVRKIVQFVDPSPEGVRGSKLTAKAIHHAERETHRDNARDLAKTLSERTAELDAMGRKFSVLYADPPWRRKAGFTDRSYENHFPTMTWDQIIGLPVKDRLLPDAWGFLWIPRAHLLALHTVEIDTPLGRTTVKLPLAWAVAQAWGFDAYSTCFVWTKTDDDHPDDMGSGLIVRDQDEILLLFKRGRGMPMPATDEKFGSNYRERSKPLGHSRKPEFYREMIRTMVGPGIPVLELFARVDDEHPLPLDFYAWGNQSGEAALGIPTTEQDQRVGDNVIHLGDPATGEILDDPSLNPAGETIPAAQGNAMEPATVTGQPPVAVGSPSLVGKAAAEPGAPALGPRPNAHYPGRVSHVQFDELASRPSADIITAKGRVDPAEIDATVADILTTHPEVSRRDICLNGRPVDAPWAAPPIPDILRRTQ